MPLYGMESEPRLPTLAPFAAATAAAAVVGARVSPATRPSTQRWYRRLRKPPYQPPPQVFGPVWTALYPLIATSGWRVYEGSRGKARRRALGLWGAQMALNGLWSPLFFGARRKRLALADSALLLGTAVGYVSQARRVDRAAAWLFLPYVGWLGYATLLNLGIVQRNPRGVRRSRRRRR